MARLFPLLALTAWLAAAQPPKIGEINFYGLHKLSGDKLLASLALRPGDPLPPSKGDLEERIGEMEGVIDARVEAVCCQGAGTALFIGIEERGAPHFSTRGDPVGSATIPEELVERYRDFVSAKARAQAAELRPIEDAFTTAAKDQLSVLRDTLRNSSEADQRAAATAIIAFAPKKSDIINDLQYALQDPDESVRANAARALKEIAIQARKAGDPSVRIAPVWLIEMLNSLALGDRLQAVQTLVVLTDRPNTAAVDQLRERAIPALSDMARWKTLEYALPAFLLLGRVAGIPEAELQDQWKRGDREPVIRQAAAKR